MCMRPIHATQLYLLDVLYLHVYITDMPPLMPSIVFGYFHFVFIYFCCSIYIFTRPMQHNCIWICSICMFTSQTCPPPHHSHISSLLFGCLYISVVVFVSSHGQCNTIVSGYAQSACLHPRHAPPISSLRPFLFYISNFLWLVFSFHVLVFISNLLPFIPFLLLHYFSFGFLFPLYLGFALPHVISSILFPCLCFFISLYHTRYHTLKH